jgi:hypothetical protein
MNQLKILNSAALIVERTMADGEDYAPFDSHEVSGKTIGTSKPTAGEGKFDDGIAGSARANAPIKAT